MITGSGDLRAVTASSVALWLRTLRISEQSWQAILQAYAAAVPAAPLDEEPREEVRRCLETLAVAFQRFAPAAAALSPTASASVGHSCPACLIGVIMPCVVRGAGADAITYGRCSSCGHGLLLSAADIHEAELRSSYARAEYYEQRDRRGVGYDAYAEEAAYREEKGARLVQRLRSLCDREPSNLLEVGSGYGFTRAAAERAGLSTAGVDLNPHACAEAGRRYGLETFEGTLREALQTPASGIRAGAWDVLLYQFVLEHVLSPAEELELARRALRPGGYLVLLVPSMEALEIDVFGGHYRSFRADHIHLMTRASTHALLGLAGFEVEFIESTCNLHLFRPFLSAGALQYIYSSGRGPDLFVLARRSQ